MTKLSRLELQSEQTKHAENFRKLVVAMSEDIRVLLVKLADRLHNMRTLESVKSPDKRRRIARETMDIYAPLAERIGMQRFKDELEDLAFAQLNPDARDSIQARMEFLKRTGEDLPDKIVGQLKRTLAEDGTEAWGFGPGQVALFDLAQNAAPECRLRTTLRSRGVSRSGRIGRALLPGSRHTAQPVPGGPGPVQGLHLDAQAERLPFAAHRCDRPPSANGSRCRSALAKCTRWRSSGSPPIGSTSKLASRSTVANTAGYANCSIFWSMRRTPRNSWSTPSSRCSRIRSFVFPPRAT